MISRNLAIRRPLMLGMLLCVLLMLGREDFEPSGICPGTPGDATEASCCCCCRCWASVMAAVAISRDRLSLHCVRIVKSVVYTQ